MPFTSDTRPWEISPGPAADAGSRRRAPEASFSARPFAGGEWLGNRACTRTPHASGSGEGSCPRRRPRRPPLRQDLAGLVPTAVRAVRPKPRRAGRSRRLHRLRRCPTRRAGSRGRCPPFAADPSCSPCSATTISSRARRTRSPRSCVDAGVTVLDGDAYEVHGIGFAGVKGFGGGFGRRALGPWGEDTSSSSSTRRRRSAEARGGARAPAHATQSSRCCTTRPIRETVEGEPLEIYPFLGSSRLEEPISRYPVSAVVHGHAHRGQLEGETPTGVPVYNVSLPLMLSSTPSRRSWSSSCPWPKRAEPALPARASRRSRSSLDMERAVHGRAITAA